MSLKSALFHKFCRVSRYTFVISDGSLYNSEKLFCRVWAWSKFSVLKREQIYSIFHIYNIQIIVVQEDVLKIYWLCVEVMDEPIGMNVVWIIKNVKTTNWEKQAMVHVQCAFWRNWVAFLVEVLSRNCIMVSVEVGERIIIIFHFHNFFN